MRLHRLCGATALAPGAAFGCLPLTTSQAQQPSSKTSDLSFMAADTNGDGLVDEAELTADQAKRFHKLDTSGDGFLTPDELAVHDETRFAQIDKNHDGRLSFTEVMQAKLIDFGAADTNGDGRLSYDEIVVFEARK